MNNSFYGGRRGASFIIAGRFNSISEMIENFSQGSKYPVINYDEYVIIDTENKNDPDNGKLFRRGYNYQDNLGGAEYIGRIVGPSGLAPQIEMRTVQEVENIQKKDGFNYRYSTGEYNTINSLVPGKDTFNFNDSIKWACCSVRDANNKDATAYIGFKIPYTVIEYSASSVDPYYKRSNSNSDFINKDLIQREDDGEHPFYEKWHVSIPKGIKGDTFKNLRVINASDLDDIEYYDGQAEDRKGKQTVSINKDKFRKILVYDYWTYNKDAQGELQSIYLGDFNTITDVALDEDGTLHVAYTHNEDTVIPKRIRWINNVSINNGSKEGEGNQKIHVQYNDGTQADIGNPLNYIMKTAITPNTYHLLFLYSDPARRKAVIAAGQNATYEGRNDWQDMGCIKNYNGILIGANYSKNHFKDSSLSGIITQLNKELPNGFTSTDVDLHGKIVTVGDDNGNKKFFGFDYTKLSNGEFKKWFYLGTFGDCSGAIAGMENDLNTQQAALALPEGSLWFVVE